MTQVRSSVDDCKLWRKDASHQTSRRRCRRVDVTSLLMHCMVWGQCGAVRIADEFRDIAGSGPVSRVAFLDYMDSIHFDSQRQIASERQPRRGILYYYAHVQVGGGGASGGETPLPAGAIAGAGGGAGVAVVHRLRSWC